MLKIDNTKFLILIVDDTPTNIQVLGNILKTCNYQIEFALNGKSALNLLKRKKFDLILLDVMMPEMDGFEVCEIIRKDSNYDNLPIIFLTAKTDQQSIIIGFEKGAQDYIKKPFDTKELLSRVNTHLELKYRRQEVLELNQSLEEKVDIRTKQLNQTLKMLEQANSELLLLDKAKSDFINIISNQLRAPLNSIKVPIQIMKNKVNTKELIQLIDVLDNSVIQLENFSALTLDYTNLKSGKRQPNFENINIAELIEFTIMRCTEFISYKKQRVDFDYDALNFSIRADYDLLLDAMVNIIYNLVHYSPNDETILIKATDKIDYIEISITNKTDVDYNINLNELSDIFNSGMENIDMNNAMKLAYAKLIIEKHNADLSIEKSITNKLTTKISLKKIPLGIVMK